MRIVSILPYEINFSVQPETFLSDDEIKKLNQLKEETRRNQFLQSRFELKKKLAEALKVPAQKIAVQGSGEGKPFIAPKSHLDFSLSHSDDFFAVAVTDQGDVGIDLEKIRSRGTEEFSRRMFSTEESETLAKQTDKLTMFTKLWAAKEAIIKAANGGVFKNIHDIELNLKNWEIKKLPTDFGELSLWSVEFLDSPAGYVCAVALRKR